MTSTCHKCTEPSVIRINYTNQHYCRTHFLRYFEARVKKQVRLQGGLKGNIMVALSGGKDSSAVLHALYHLYNHIPDFKITAVTIDEGIKNYREESLDICQNLINKLPGVEWQVYNINDHAGYTIDDYAAGKGVHETNQDRPSCGACGIWRRYLLNKAAQDLEATAVITGHNLDDAAQTILMNVLKGDLNKIRSMAPHTLNQVDGMAPRLLPFREIPEKEVLLYCILNDLEIQTEHECPYADRSKRFNIRDTLNGLEQQNPGTRHSLMAFHDKLRTELPPETKTTNNKCQECGEPSYRPQCMACNYKAPHMKEVTQ